MSRKSKFVNNIVFINDKYYHNERDRSPYIFVFSVYEDKKRNPGFMNINFVNLHGLVDSMFMGKSYMYKKLEILDVPHLQKDFIRNIFLRSK